MVTEVYIGKVKSEKFDYDAAGNWDGYFPEALCEKQFCHELYFDIVGDVCDKKPNTKQTDWGCFVIKLSKAGLIEYLGKEKYKKDGALHDIVLSDKKKAEYLLGAAENLPDTEEYLLVALEGVSMEAWDDGEE